MSAQIVVDISSDDEDNAVKRSTKTRPTAKPAPNPTRTIVKNPSRIPPTAEKPTVSAPATTAGCPVSTQPRNHQSTTAATPITQREQEAPKDPTLPAVQITSTPSTITSSSLPDPPTTVDEPPKPTPLDINAFRHLVCAGSVPAAKDSPLITSIQPVASSKRKAIDALDDDNMSNSRRPRPASPLPPTPYTGTSERPVPPKSNNNAFLWSVPAYKTPPPPLSSQSTSIATSTSNPSPSPLLKQPSIPNIHAPLALTTTQPPPFAVLPTPSTPTPTPTTTKPPTSRRRRESKWTHAQLANLASAIETAFAPAMESFAKENKKTLGQVRETYSFLVNGRIFEFSDEGREQGVDGDGKDGRGRGRGRGGGRGVARRFEREMRGGRKATEKLMNQVHRKEASEGHWASLGMSQTCKEKEKQKKRTGVLERAIQTAP